MTSEQSNIPHPKEVHMFPSSTTSVTSSWASPKVSASRISDIHNPVSTILTSSINNPIYSTKSESRSSKVSNVSKNSSAFTQQSGFPLGYETSVVSRICMAYFFSICCYLYVFQRHKKTGLIYHSFSDLYALLLLGMRKIFLFTYICMNKEIRS